MNKKVYIGIDNGVTGTISIYNKKEVDHFPVPTKKELSYTKTKQYITRIDINSLIRKIDFYVGDSSAKALCLVERPMVNPMRFKASMSAIRALEATLIVLEDLKIPYQYIDSKEWQKEFLPKKILNLKSKNKSAELKKSAIDVARRLFPDIKTKDADSLLIMEYARRKNL